MTTAQPDQPREDSANVPAEGSGKEPADEQSPTEDVERSDAPERGAEDQPDLDELKALADENWNKFLRASAEGRECVVDHGAFRGACCDTLGTGHQPDLIV